MQLEKLTLIGLFFPYIIVFLMLYIYTKKIIRKNGFNTISLFILTYTLFYLVVPFIQTFFKSHRNYTSLFTQLLNLKTDNEVLFNFVLAFICLIVILISYNFDFKKNIKVKPRKITKLNPFTYKKMLIMTRILFFVSSLSIILLIVEVGSISNYLALGAYTRGVETDPTQFVRSSFLPLITFSVLILAPPYLYLFLYRVKNNKGILIEFVFSFLCAALYLLYNQGRAPLIVFLLPFIFTLRKNKRKNLLILAILFVIGLFSLKYLDGIFNYLSYGNFYIDNSINYITEFLGEFSYPFANFSHRHELSNFSGFRFFYDYIIWPFTMIPDTLLSLIGINKEAIVSIGELNTQAYGYWLGVIPEGGVPVDFLTFNYYQFGYLSLFGICYIVGKILRKLDLIFYIFEDYFPIRIILYRISFSIINIINNADLSAIIRNRLDVVIIVGALIYIFRRELKLRNNQNSYQTDDLLTKNQVY